MVHVVGVIPIMPPSVGGMLYTGQTGSIEDSDCDNNTQYRGMVQWVSV